MDLSRVQVFDAQPQRGYSIKSLRLHSRGKYGFAHAPRNLFMIRVRELTLEETFHKYYIKGDVPQSLSADMRLAVHEGQFYTLSCQRGERGMEGRGWERREETPTVRSTVSFWSLNGSVKCQQLAANIGRFLSVRACAVPC